jgi:2-keto-3-deoxy-L-rhamnonate aldolase RhmA
MPNDGMPIDGTAPIYGALKARLQSGEACFGFWCHLFSNIATELLAEVGFDCALIDLEHGAGSYLDAIAQMQAMKAAGCTPLLRVPSNEPVSIKRALDAGAAGLMIPSISSAEEARAAVAACFYPPKGMRGAAPGIIRATDYGLRAADYVAGIDEKLLTVLQIETVAGVEAIDDIAAVEGVDVLFVGPMDLSADAGHFGRTDHPEVLALIERVEQAAQRHGKALGSIIVPGRSAEQLLANGHRLILGHSDLDFLRQGATDALAMLRGLAR